MRHYPSCWNRTLAKLGFRRLLRSRAKAIPGRLSRIESLEARQLLAADVSITQFNVDADPTKLHVAYQVATGPADDDYAINIYRSLDGVTPYLDAIHSEPIDKDDATGDFTFKVHFGNDTLEDYYFIAVAEDADSSPSNNTRVFEGGAFEDTSGIVQYHGAIGTVNDDVQVILSNGLYKLQRLQGGSYVTLFEQDESFAVHGRAHGGDDLLTVTASDVQAWFFGGEGNDTLHGSGSSDYLEGGAGNDWLYGHGGNDHLRGGSGNDIGYGGDGADLIYGDDGDDDLWAELGDDSIYAGTGDDTAYGGDGADLLHGDAGNDVGYGGSGNDVYLYKAADQGSFADVIVEDSSVDTDKLDFSAFTPAVFIDLGVTTQLSVTSTLRLTLSSATGIEDVVGTELADVIIGNARNNVFEGGAGSDYFEGHGGVDVIRAGVGDDVGYGGGGNDEWWGGEGSDQFWGEADDDLIYGEAGDDGGYGGDGDDVAYGGEGNDYLTGNTGADLTYGDAGDDAILSGDGDDVAYGGDGADELQGESGVDWLYGDAGDDSLTGGAGSDHLIGDDGSDYYYFSSWDVGEFQDEIVELGESQFDVDALGFYNFAVAVDLGLTTSQIINSASNQRILLSSSTSIENVYGSSFADVITGNARNNIIYGYNGNDVIHGGAGNDLLFGGNNDDDLYGDAGGDILYGEVGNDDLYGGTQNDILIQAAGGGTLEWESGQGSAPDKIIVTTMVDEFETISTTGFGIEDLSLREAIVVAANQAGTDAIEFDESATGLLELTGTRLFVNTNVSIKGHGSKSTVIDAKGLSGVVYVPAGVTATLEDLKLTGGGNELEGGGVFNSGALTLNRVEVSGNSSSGTGGGITNRNYTSTGINSLYINDSTISDNHSKDGSGIAAYMAGGALEIRGSTIANNVTQYAIDATGAVWSSAGGLMLAGNLSSALIHNSTISGNSAQYAGAIRLWAVTTPLNIVNSTIVDNRGLESGGIHLFANSSSPIVHNSIVADNWTHQSTPARVDVHGSLDAASSHNIFGAGRGSTALTGAGNQVGTSGTPIDPKLGPLADNGGATRTHALLAGSPAFDAGSGTIAAAAGVTTDQRGEVRNDGSVDIGAYETELVVSTLVDESDGDYSVGDLSLREALLLAGWNAASNEITFDSSLAGTIVLNPTLGQLSVTSSVKLVGPGADKLAIDANEASRALLVSGTGTLVVEISGLTIAGGKIEGDGAGIYNDGENLTLTRVTVTDNHAWGTQGLGGGLFAQGGQLTIHESTFYDNDATRGGAVRTQYGTTLTIAASTFYGNEATAIEGALSAHQTTATITNSTFSGNSAPSGGAIRTNSTGQMTIINSTIVNNTATTGYGGGIQVGGGTVTLHNTILAANTAGAAAASNDVNGALDPVSSYNIIGSGANGQSFTGVHNKIGASGSPIDPMLAPLANYDGPTLTHALLVGSPAIDSGNDSLVGGYDQRGNHVRPIDSPTTANLGTNKSDIGAFEAGNPTPYVVRTLDDELDLDASGNVIDDSNWSDLSLREAIYLAGRNAEEESIEFDSSLFSTPQTIHLKYEFGDSGLSIIGDNDITIDGPGANLLTISGDRAGYQNVFVVPGQQVFGLPQQAFADITISGLTITGGHNAGIAVQGFQNVLILEGVEITGNGIGVNYQSGQGLTIVDSSISRNSYEGVKALDGPVTLRNVTVSGNAGAGVSVASASLAATHATIVGNSKGVIANANGLITLNNSIIVGNVDNGTPSDLHRPFATGSIGGHDNIVGFGFLTGLPTPDNVSGKTLSDLKLTELGRHGGATRTHALLPGSIAINGGDNGWGTITDQRGKPRVDAPAGGDSKVDVGAFELEQGWNVTADFDNDGRNDQLYVDWVTGNVNVLRDLGSGLQLDHWGNLPAGINWSDFQVGDFNGDGRDDLIVREPLVLGQRDEWTLLLSESSRFVVREDVIVDQDWSRVLVGDFDGDGSDEMIGWDIEKEVANSAQHSWEAFHYSEQTGGKIDEGFNAWGRFPGYLDGFEIAGIWVADVNQDGRDDLVSKVTKTPPGDFPGWWVGMSTNGPHFDGASNDNDILFTGPNHFDVRYWGSFFDKWYNKNSKSLDPEQAFRDLATAFREVHDTVDLELYHGFKKGPEAALESKFANPWDQAAALVRKLEGSPFNPRLFRGFVKAPVLEVMNWLGARNEAAAEEMLKVLSPYGTTSFTKSTENQIEYITFPHVWVQVDFPTKAGLATLDLDPSWKLKDYQPGIPLSPVFDEMGYLNSTVPSSTELTSETPLDFFESSLQRQLTATYTGKSLADVPYEGKIRPASDGDVMRGMGGAIVGAFTQLTGASPSNNLNSILEHEYYSHRMRLSLITTLDEKDDLNVPRNLWFKSNVYSMALNAYTNFEYVLEPAGGSTVHARLYVNGQTGTGDFAPKTLNLYNYEQPRIVLEYFTPGTPVPTITNGPEVWHRSVATTNISFNEVVGVSINVNQFSNKKVEEIANSYRNAIVQAESGESEPAGSKDVDDLERLALAQQWNRYNASAFTVAALTQSKPVLGVAMGVVRASRSLLNDGDPLRLTPQFFSVEKINAINTDTTFIDNGAGVSAYERGQLMSWQGSAIQSQVPEELVASHGVSAVRLLQRAYQGQSFEKIVHGNQYLQPGGNSKIHVLEAIVSPDDGYLYIGSRGFIGASFNTGQFTYEGSSTPYSPPTYGSYWYGLGHTSLKLADINTSQEVRDAITELGNLASSRWFTYGNKDVGVGHSTLITEAAEFLANSLRWDSTNSQAVFSPSKIYIPQGVLTVGSGVSTGGWQGSGFLGERVNEATFYDFVDQYDLTEQYRAVNQGFSGGIDSTGTYQQYYRSSTPPVAIPTLGLLPAAVTTAVDGSVRISASDIVFPNPGVSLDFDRRYDSRSAREVGMGKGWTHSFSDRLLWRSGSTDGAHPHLTWLTSSGVEHKFSYNDSLDVYVVPDELLGTFTETGSKYVFTDQQGFSIEFEKVSSPGTTDGALHARLAKKTDIVGNGIQVSYANNTNEIADVREYMHSFAGGISPTPRRLHFEYQTYGTGGDVKRYINRIDKYEGASLIGSWTYGYADLTGISSVTTPPIESPGDPTPSPYVTKYFYYGATYGSTTPSAFKGLLQRIETPEGSPVEFEYYANRTLFRETRFGESDATKYRKSYYYDFLAGKTRIVDERGNEEVFYFDQNGLLTRQIHADRTRTETKWGVSSGGVIISGTQFLKTEYRDEVGAVETYDYYTGYLGNDSYLNKQLESTVSKHFPGALPNTVVGLPGVVTTFEYSRPNSTSPVVNLKTTIVNPDLDGGTSLPNENLTTTFTYDPIGRPSTSTDAAGNVTVFSYYTDGSAKDGLLKSKTLHKGIFVDSSVPNNEAVTWAVLNPDFDVTGSTLSVRLLAEAGAGGGNVVADAIRIDRIDAGDSFTAIIDDVTQSGAFSFTIDAPGANVALVNTDRKYRSAATLITPTTGRTNTATWQFTGLEPGSYRISAVWAPTLAAGETGRDSTAKYQVFDGVVDTTPDAQPTADHQAAPASATTWFNSFETIYNYDPAGNLTTATTEGLPASTATYDHTGAITGIVDATGVTTSFDVDVLGRTTGVHQLGNGTTSPQLVSTVLYDGNNQVTSVTDALGRVVTSVFDRRGNLTQEARSDGSVVRHSYDQANNRISTVDAMGRLTRFVYDARNRLIQTIHADDASAQVRYDGVGRIAAHIDGRGNVTTFEYDAGGRLSESIEAFGAGGLVESVVTNKYDVVGRLVESIDGAGVITQYAYDKLSRVIQSRTLSKSENAAGARALLQPITPVFKPVTLTTTAYDAHGNVAEQIVYDVSLLATADVDTSAEMLTLLHGSATGLPSDPLNAPKAFFDHSSRPALNGKYQTTKFAYDSFNRVTSVTHVGAGVAGGDVVTRTSYDAEGRVRHAYDEAGRASELVYDAYGRLWKTIAPDPDGPSGAPAPITIQTYDAVSNVVQVTDDLGRVTSRQYDALNRLVTTTDATGATTRSILNIAGEVIATVDALGRAIYYKRDERGRVVQERLSDPDQGGRLAPPVTTYAYDKAGNVERMIDARGFYTDYVHDARNRVIEEQLLSGSVIYGDDWKSNGVASEKTLGFTTTGTRKDPSATDAAKGFGGDYVDLQTPGGTATATWTFENVEQGDYRIALSWLAAADLDPSATVKVTVNGVTRATWAGVDLRITPTLHTIVTNQQWFARNDDGEWQTWRLPAYSLLPGTVAENATVVVELRSSTGGKIRADGVMLEKTSAKNLFKYDDNNNLTHFTDAAGRETVFQYDELNRQSKVTLPDPDGPSTATLNAPVTEYQYDGYGNLKKVTDRSGAGATTVDRTDEWVYDKRNRVTDEKLGSNVVATQLHTKYGYDDVGNLRSLQEAVDGTFIETKFDYDNLDRLKEERVLATAGVDSSWMTKATYAYYGGTQAVATRTDFTRDSVTQAVAETHAKYAYDAVDRIVSETRDAFGIAAQSRYVYDAVGNLIRSVDASGRDVKNQYDALNRLIVSMRPDVLPGDKLPSTLVDKYQYDPSGNLVASTNAKGETTRFDYDAQGRQIRAIDPKNAETRYRYDSVGNLRQLVDPDGNVTRYLYDRLDRVTSETNHLNKTRSYVYNDRGNLDNVTDRIGRVTNYTYDNLDRLKTEAWKASAGASVTTTLSWGYDQLGRLVSSSETDNVNTTVLYAESFAYDNLSRVTAVRNFDPSITTSVPKVEHVYKYDVVPNSGAAPVQMVRNQRFAGLTTNAATTTYEFDALGRLTDVGDLGAASTPLATIDSKTIEFGYDLAGRLTGIERNGPAGFQFDTSYKYDAAGRLQRIAHALNGASTSTSPFSTYDYGYDAADRIVQVDAFTKIGQIDLTRQEIYAYDLVGQLTGVTPKLTDRNVGSNNLTTSVPTQAYRYDAAGNRISDNSVAQTIGDANQVSTDGVYDYLYDDEGNLSKKTQRVSGTPDANRPEITYLWDNRNRLIEVIERATPSGTITEHIKYRYNNDDLRVQKEVVVGTASTEHYVYEGDQLSLVLDNSGNVKNRYLYAPGTDALLVDEVFSGGAQVESRWVATDHAGTVRDVIDGDNHALLEHREYEPFGELTKVVDGAKANVSPSALATDFAFAGREWDYESDLYYNRARWLDEDLGRFISEDPIGFAGGDANLYRYAGNDSINRRDPSGLYFSFSLFDVGVDLGLLDSASSWFAGVDLDYLYSASSWFGSNPLNLGLNSFLGSTGVATAIQSVAYLATGLYQNWNQTTSTTSGMSIDEFNRGLMMSSSLSSLASSDPSFADPFAMQNTMGFNPDDATRVVKIEQINSGKAGEELYNYGMGNFLWRQSRGDYGMAAAHMGVVYLGAFFDMFPDTAPAYKVTFADGHSIVRMGGDVDAYEGMMMAAEVVTAGSLPNGLRRDITPDLPPKTSKPSTSSTETAAFGAPGAKVKIGSVDATEMAGRLSSSEMAALQQEYGREFAQIYITGPGKNGGGGKYYLIRGNSGDVTIPIGPNVRVINHTHPQAYDGELLDLVPSDEDFDVLRMLQDSGSPQSRSQIVPEVGDPFYFKR